MGINDRRKNILELVTNDGFASIDKLSSRFGVSAQTVRRDIMYLESKELVVRHHGGAGIRSSIFNVNYQDRHTLRADAKLQLANRIASTIPAKCSLFIAGGTTMEAVARSLTKCNDLKIITNSLHVAGILNNNDTFEVVTTGGTLRKNNGVIVGPDTVAFVDKFRCDFAVIGCGGIEEDGVFLDFDSQEVATVRKMIANSRKVFIGADSSKFPGKANVLLATAEEVDALYTEAPPPASLMEVLSAKGVDVRIDES